MGGINCAALSSRGDFPDYVNLLQNATDGDFSRIISCRAEVCGALWGQGNPDISGIGMAVGYVIEITLYVAIVSAFLWLHHEQKQTQHIYRLLLANATKTYCDSALFYAFAIQLASTFTLAQADFGVSADGMGAITMQIAWTISSMTLLPLLPLVLNPTLFVGTEASNERFRERQGQRFVLFVLCWMPSFYPFYSRMAETFGRSRIGESGGAVISTIDWGKIYDACFAGVETISQQNENVMLGFGITSWLVLSVIVIAQIVKSALKEQLKQIKDKLQYHFPGYSGLHNWILHWWAPLNLIVVLLLAGQLWTFFRLQRFQRDMIQASGGNFLDGNWSFGQIVSVVVFLPVLVEVFFLWRKRVPHVSYPDC